MAYFWKLAGIALILGLVAAGREFEFDFDLHEALLKGYDEKDYTYQFTYIYYDFPVDITLEKSSAKELTFKVEPEPYQSPGMKYNSRRYDIEGLKLKIEEQKGAKVLLLETTFKHDDLLGKTVTITMPIFRNTENGILPNGEEALMDSGLKEALLKFSKNTFNINFELIGHLFDDDNLKKYTKTTLKVGRYNFITRPEIVEESVFQNLIALF